MPDQIRQSQLPSDDLIRRRQRIFIRWVWRQKIRRWTCQWLWPLAYSGNHAPWCVSRTFEERSRDLLERLENEQ